VTDGLLSQAEHCALDLSENSSGVHLGACSTKAGWLKFNGPILEHVIEYLCLDSLLGQSTKVRGTMECREVVGGMVFVCHGTHCLRKFGVILSWKGGRSRMINSHKVNEVD
jgi:hypothetical protein